MKFKNTSQDDAFTHIMKDRRKYYYPCGRPKRIRIGDRFQTLTDNTYYSRKYFRKGSKATFLGWRLWERLEGEKQWRWPKFQFDDDDHKERVLVFNQLRKI